MRLSNSRTWIKILLGSLFFFYGYFQVNMMNALEEPLTQYFHTSAGTIGLLSANFFYTTMLLTLPAGLLLDRFPIRTIMLTNMGIAIFGMVLFAYSISIAMAAIARLICGVMMSFCMLAEMKRASLLLPPKFIALASSLIVTVGMLGGLSANIVMESLVVSFGWRNALLVIAALGVVIAIILFFCVGKEERDPHRREHANIWKSLGETIKESQNWFCGFFTCLLNLPLAILGALFGISYLMQVFHSSEIEAAAISSMLFLGLIFGTALFGWISDLSGKRRPSMIIGSILCLLLMVFLLYSEQHSALILYILMFAIGFTSGAQVLGYPVIIHSNPPHLTATALGFASIIIMGLGYGLGLPFIGWMLDLFWKGKMAGGVPFYEPSTYMKAFLAIPICIGISVILALVMKEKKGKAT